MVLKTIPVFEKPRLDRIDKKVLFYLSQDLRYPRNKLSSELKISPQKLAYRINRLIGEIIQPTLLINYPLLKLPSYIILLKDLKEEDKRKIEKAEETYLFMQLIGNYSYYLQAISEDIEDFCKKHLDNYTYEIYPLQEYIPDNFNPFEISFNKKKITPRIINKKEPPILDRYDYKLLLELSRDPLQSNLEISQHARIDRITVKKRLDKLLHLNIIQKFRYAADVFKYGFILYELKIKTPLNSMQKILSAIDHDKFSGFRYRSFNTILMSYIPPSHTELFSFIEYLRKFDQSIEIEVMQNTGTYIIETIPEIVKGHLSKKAVNPS